MPPRYSATPVSRIRRRLSSTTTSTASPSRSWSPHAAFAAAAERARAGTLSPEDAHHLFDDLLRQTAPVPQRSLNGFLAALARAPDSAACRDGPALAVALYNRVRREEAGQRAGPPTVHTYGILMDCCCRARRPDLGLAFFGCLLRTGLKTNEIFASSFLKCLCCANRADEAVNLLFHRMPELGCVRNAFSYSIVLKSLCDDRRSQQALDLLHMMAKEGGTFFPGVVAYTTVIHGFFKEGEVGKACNLFHEMMQQGIVSDVVRYSSIIDALCKARAMDKAESVLRQMVDNGVQPNIVTYNVMIHGYSNLGRWNEATNMFREMIRRGLIPDNFTWNSFMASLCKHGRSKEAAQIFDSMAAKGQHKHDILSYSILLHGYATEGCVADMINLYNSMAGNGILADCCVFNILIDAYAKAGMLDEAMLIFNEMQGQGVSLNAVTYSSVIAALCRKGKLADAMDKFSQMISTGVQPNTAVYHALIQGYCTHGDLGKAKELVYEMRNKAGGLVPNASSYGIMIKNLLKEGSVEEAENMFSSMEKNGCVPSSRLINDIIRLMLKKGEIAKAGNYMSKADGEGISLDASTTSLLISLFSRNRKYQDQIKSLPVKYHFFYGVT